MKSRLARIFPVITGFNTDIKHGGVTYHVQTEDKGLDTPLILSLVYVGGAILASKRTNYQDLIEEGFDEKSLTERLQRQHKLICAAIKSGRIADLQRMSERDNSVRAQQSKDEKESVAEITEVTEVTEVSEVVSAEESVATAPENVSREKFAEEILVGAEVFEMLPAYEYGGIPDAGWSDAADSPQIAVHAEVAAESDPEVGGKVTASESFAFKGVPLSPGAQPYLYINLLDDEGDFRAGQLVTIKLRVGRGQYGKVPVREATVTIKVLGTTFRPIILSTTTNDDGLATVRALLPRFTSGRAAILIRASAFGHEAELRRIIHQA